MTMREEYRSVTTTLGEQCAIPTGELMKLMLSALS